MKSLMSFRSLLWEEKTLIMACHENVEGAKRKWNDNVFLISSPGNVLQGHSDLQLRSLKHYLEEKGCKQIVIVGSNHPDAIKKIQEETSAPPLAEDLSFNLRRFSINNFEVNRAFFEKALLELNVIQQCNLLLAYDFIRERVYRKQLRVVGILKAAKGTEALQVFYNGVSYNHIVSFN